MWPEHNPPCSLLYGRHRPRPLPTCCSGAGASLCCSLLPPVATQPDPGWGHGRWGLDWLVNCWCELGLGHQDLFPSLLSTVQPAQYLQVHNCLVVLTKISVPYTHQRAPSTATPKAGPHLSPKGPQTRQGPQSLREPSDQHCTCELSLQKHFPVRQPCGAHRGP